MKTPVSEPFDNSAENPGGEDEALVSAAAAIHSIEKQLVARGSIELTSGVDAVKTTQDVLPAETPVYIPSLPGKPIMENLAVLRKLTACGLEPVPHLAARRLNSSDELRQFLDIAVREAAVKQVMLIGGDIATPNGPYDSAEAVLQSGILQRAEIRTVGIAAYPEPHPQIDKAELDRSLAAKVDLIQQGGLSPIVVSQFSLDPGKLVAMCKELARKYPALPVYAGIPGPTSVRKLIGYARICGVGTSLRVLKSMGLRAARLGDRDTANQQIRALATFCAEDDESTVEGVHLFSFGGFRESVDWMVDRSGRASGSS